MNNEFIYISCKNKKFPYYSAKKLFEVYKNLITENKLGFIGLIKRTKPFFYAVFVDGEFKGCLFVNMWDLENKRCEIGGFSRRKSSKEVTQGIKYFCRYIFSNFEINKIYVDTKHSHSAIAVIRAGFKRKGNILFMTRSNINV